MTFVKILYYEKILIHLFILQVLGIVVGTLLQDQEIHGTNFQQFGYQRIFIMLFLELSAHDPILENISVGVSF